MRFGTLYLLSAILFSVAHADPQNSFQYSDPSGRLRQFTVLFHQKINPDDTIAIHRSMVPAGGGYRVTAEVIVYDQILSSVSGKIVFSKMPVDLKHLYYDPEGREYFFYDGENFVLCRGKKETDEFARELFGITVPAYPIDVVHYPVADPYDVAAHSRPDDGNCRLISTIIPSIDTYPEQHFFGAVLWEVSFVMPDDEDFSPEEIENFLAKLRRESLVPDESISVLVHQQH